MKIIQANGEEHAFYNFGEGFSIPFMDAGLGVIHSGEIYVVLDFVSKKGF